MIRENYDSAGTLAELRRAGADRVLLALPRSMKETPRGRRIDADRFMEIVAREVPRCRAAGIEPAVWLGETMGHGMGVGQSDAAYQPFVSITGRESVGGYCCADPLFREDVCRWAARAAETGAALILLDDDWRMNSHGDGLWPGCLCPDHIRRYNERIGETLSREEIARRVFTGGPSPYRDAWRALMGGDMLRLAREIRAAVDRVNPACRIGICAAPTAVGMDGADFMETADALAGGTAPFVRLIGAPYWARSGAELAAVAALERMEAGMAAAWREDAHGGRAEVVLEGDVYPRPRHAVPAAYLECADQIARADGHFTGAMKYMLDYTASPRYEHGYVDRHVKNAALAAQIEAMFRGKRSVGFRPLEDPTLFCRMEFSSPDPFVNFRYAYDALRGLSLRALTDASLPICFAGGVPVLFGENARLLDAHPDWADALRHGAVLDAEAAEILAGQGWDVGAAAFGGEYDAAAPETFSDGERVGFHGVRCRAVTPAAGAEILSRTADGAPAAFRYENAAGARYLVYPVLAGHGGAGTFFRSYARHEELMREGRRIAAAFPTPPPLWADCPGNPDLTILTAVGADGEIAVGLWNLFPDAVETPVVTLDAAPRAVRFVGCRGTADGAAVTLSRIEPFGFAGLVCEFDRSEKEKE